MTASISTGIFKYGFKAIAIIIIFQECEATAWSLPFDIRVKRGSHSKRSDIVKKSVKFFAVVIFLTPDAHSHFLLQCGRAGYAE